MSISGKKIPYMKKPCENCPFRKDSSGIKGLGKGRAEEISLQNMQHGFVCHKTVDYDKEVDDSGNRRQCAGALILAQKTKTEQPFLRLHQILVGGELELLDKEVIVDTYEEFVKIQS